jgi:hypothetical protein
MGASEEHRAKAPERDGGLSSQARKTLGRIVGKQEGPATATSLQTSSDVAQLLIRKLSLGLHQIISGKHEPSCCCDSHNCIRINSCPQLVSKLTITPYCFLESLELLL